MGHLNLVLDKNNFTTKKKFDNRKIAKHRRNTENLLNTGFHEEQFCLQAKITIFVLKKKQELEKKQLSTKNTPWCPTKSSKSIQNFTVVWTSSYAKFHEEHYCLWTNISTEQPFLRKNRKTEANTILHKRKLLSYQKILNEFKILPLLEPYLIQNFIRNIIANGQKF